MIGIILAAGRGSRMGAMTEALPKCLIPLQGRPLLDYQIASLRLNGIRDIFVIGGYQYRKIVRADITLLQNPEWETTNMVATLASALPHLEKDFVLSYGDIVYRPGYVGALLAEPEESAVIVDRKWLDLWALRFADPYQDAETMVIGENGRIRELGKKITDPSKVDGQYTGLMKFTGNGRVALVDHLRELMHGGSTVAPTFRKMYMTDFIQSLINRNVPVKAVMVENGWLELDSDRDFALYERLAQTGELGKFFDPSAYAGG